MQNIPLNQITSENEVIASIDKYFERPELHIPLFFHTKFNFSKYSAANNRPILSQLKIRNDETENTAE